MTDTSVNHFEWCAKVLLYLFAFLLPVWFIPLPVGIEFGRAVTFSSLILLVTLCWLLGILTKGAIRFQYSPALLCGILFIAVVSVSTFFSASPMGSFIFSEIIAEQLFTLIMGLLLMVVIGSLLSSPKDAKMVVFLLIVAGAASAIMTIVQLIFGISVYTYLVSFAGGDNFNLVGTPNGLSLFYVALLVTALGVVAYEKELWLRSVCLGAIVLFLVNLVLINYFYSWIVFLVAAVLLLCIKLKDVQGRGKKFTFWYALFALFVAFAIVMLMVRIPVLTKNPLPAEVSPSFQSTIAIGKSLMAEGPRAILLGSGPGTFGLDWLRYKDASINQSQFWEVRFNQGFSWASTLLPTTGVLGSIAFIIFIAITFFLFLRSFLLHNANEDGVAVGSFLGFVAVSVSAFLYPATLTNDLLLFFTAGLVTALVGERRELAGDTELMLGVSEEAITGEEDKSFFGITERIVVFETSWLIFFSSLFAIFFLALGVAVLYFQVGRVQAALAVRMGTDALNKGDAVSAVRAFSEAIQIHGSNPAIQQALVRGRIAEIQQILQKAVNGENVQQEFQSAVSAAVQESQRMVDLKKYDSDVWRTQGALYELLTPFIAGSERFAFDSYRKASEFDPKNPAIYTDLGRAHLVYADRLLAIVNQGAPDRDKQVREREEILKNAVLAFDRAVDAKQDYASAHYLMAQAALLLGNIERAIKSVEGAKLAAPFDIGIAFQLGLLYYQTNDLGRARGEFERAASLNNNYSNARYFLGLVYDRQNEKQRAIAEFEKVLELNPDNQEVIRIIANLRQGKSALSGIVPPDEVPEKRKETPVKK